MPNDRGIGKAVYERVNELVAKEGLNKSEAFHKVGIERKMNIGTVSANYYRIARGLGIGRGRRHDRKSNHLDRLLNDLDKLTADIRTEIDKLKKGSVPLDQIKTLIEG